MDLKVKPAFRIIANDEDITQAVVDRFRALRLSDETGTTSDTLEITLADHIPDQPIALPPTGAELDVSLGYEGSALRYMGRFVCDEVEVGGFPSYLAIRCRASPYEESTKGQKDLQTHKSRSWKAGTTIGAMVKKIASEHGLKPAVAAALASIALPHTDQTNESDMNLLLRIAKRYDAVAKPAAGSLVFAVRGAGESVTGQALPRIDVAAKDVSSYRMSIARRDSPGTVITYYRDIAKAERHQVKVGDGDPVKTIRHQFRNKAQADAAAKAEQARRTRAESSLSMTFPGNPDVVAEGILSLGEGFHAAAAGDWLVKSAEHYMGPNGYTTSVNCERPTGDAEDEGADEVPPNVDAGE